MQSKMRCLKSNYIMADATVRTKRNRGTSAPLPAPGQSLLCPRIWYNKVSKQLLRTIYHSVCPTQGILLFWSFYMVKNCHVTLNPLNLDLTKHLSLIISVRYTCQTDIKLIIYPSIHWFQGLLRKDRRTKPLCGLTQQQNEGGRGEKESKKTKNP